MQRKNVWFTMVVFRNRPYFCTMICITRGHGQLCMSWYESDDNYIHCTHHSNDGINEKYLLKAVETAVSRISFHWIIWKIPSDRQKVFYGATFKPYPGCYISYARCCAGTWSWVLTQKVKLFIAFSNYIIPASTSALSQICMQTPPIWCESDMCV